MAGKSGFEFEEKTSSSWQTPNCVGGAAKLLLLLFVMLSRTVVVFEATATDEADDKSLVLLVFPSLNDSVSPFSSASDD